MIVAAAWVANLGSIVLIVVGVLGIERFCFRTLYRVRLDGHELQGRALLRNWVVPLSEIDVLLPGWRQSWWKANAHFYIVRRRSGRQLCIWCGKGLLDFLEVLGSVEPGLSLRDDDAPSKTERSRGRSGFSVS